VIADEGRGRALVLPFVLIERTPRVPRAAS